MMKKLIIIPVLALSLSACNENSEGFGTLIGGVLGGIIGSEVSDGSTGGILLGAAVGAAIGNNIGSQLDDNDRNHQQYAFQQAMEYNQTGATSDWYNPDSGNSGSFVPQPAYEADNRYCREFTQTVQIANEDQEMYGTACRQPDGTWKIDTSNTRSSTTNNTDEPSYKKY